jgi:hypothetical protein
MLKLFGWDFFVDLEADVCFFYFDVWMFNY